MLCPPSLLAPVPRPLSQAAISPSALPPPALVLTLCFLSDGVAPVVGQPQGVPIPPPEFGPPPYEPPSQPGFVPPHMPTDTSGPYMPPGEYCEGLHEARSTVLVPSGAATTVTVLQGEIFQGAPVQTVCPHCQQAITTKITYEIGLMSFLLGFFCCFVG
uniref:Cell death-inducing p53-target protein 1 n=1 Tax=Strix occidentalis caurina TaxID=311401 RepID=A0A8D0F2T3_STROC